MHFFSIMMEKYCIKIKKFIKENPLFLTFVIASLINTTLLRFVTVKNYTSYEPVLADFSIILMIASFGFLIKQQKRIVYYFGMSVFMVLLCLVNSMYYSNYLSYASFSLIATSLQLVDVGDAVVNNIMELKDFFYLWQIFALLFVYKATYKKMKLNLVKKEERIKCLDALVLSFIVLGFFISTVTGTDLSRLGKQWNREYVVMKFGILIYQGNDLIASVKPQISPLFGYDEAAKNFREFYEQKDYTKTKNQYTDIFKGKNILMIHAESIQNFTLGLEFNGVPVTPTLNRLSKEGLYFSNFYAQESVGTSSDSEFTLNTSLMPATNGTVFVSYWDREYLTIPKILKEQGYYSFSMHGNKGSFWNRNVVHQQFGYDNFYYYTKDFVIDEVIQLGLSDKSFFRQAVPKIQAIQENYGKFYGTLIMLTNHTPFTDIAKISEYAVDYKYEKVNEEGITETVSAPYLEGTTLGNYIKSVNYADSALGELMEDLDQSGLLENTVVVIYGDHDAKLKRSEYVRFYNYDPENDQILSSDDPNYVPVDYYSYELNREVPLIIWSKDQKLQTEVTKVMGMYDVLPTLGNMFGFESKYALGHDIFSIDENVVVFPDGNWLTDKMYYNSQKGESKLLDTTFPVSVEYIEKYTKYAEQLITVSNDIIVHDLIRKTRESVDILNIRNKKS